MRILIAHPVKLPFHSYGGSERVVWWLGKALAQAGHEVTYLVKKGSKCPFAKVLALSDKVPLAAQIPEGTDIVHFHFQTEEEIPVPHLFTLHTNSTEARTFHPNTVFVSRDHARRHGGSVFVHNGFDPDDYGQPLTDNRRMFFHFLGHAAIQVKNVRGAIDIAEAAGERLHVIGGSRINFRQGLRITLSPQVRFHGMLSGDGKNALLQASKGLVFPVLWHEPFGLVVVESLYFGCPVFGTPYGALPELLGSKAGNNGRQWNGAVDEFHSEFGFLSIKKAEIAEALKEVGHYDPHKCQEYAAAHFSSRRMAADYLKLYEKILAGKPLHAKPPVLAEAPSQRFLPLI